MKIAEANQLTPGVYRLWWKRDGWSVAVVGMLHSGRRWFACVNWTAEDRVHIASTCWREVEFAERLEVVGCPRRLHAPALEVSP